MQLSKHLELAEMIRSDSAKRLGISNAPTPQHIENMKQWGQYIFEPIREHFKRPIFISSGYRSAELNAKTKGASKTSQHSLGEAGDIDMDGTEITNLMIFKFIKDNLYFDQLIAEFPINGDLSWVHVSFKKGVQRKQILVAKKVGGKTTYFPYVSENSLK
jgi:zinc D-Ala-D-Ala carboxypeptidase